MQEEISKDTFTSVYMFVTNRCNLACSYCYESDREGDMSKETMKETIDWLIKQRSRFERSSENEDISITFFGGEPLLNFPVVKYGMEYCREKFNELGIDIGLYILTNGTILTDEIYDFLKEAKKWQGTHLYVQVSMDGCEESHNENRVFAGSNLGSFSLVAKNIRRFKEIFPQLMVRQTVIPGNIDSLAKDFTAILESGGTVANLTPIVEGEWTKENIDKYCNELDKCIDSFWKFPGHEDMSFNYVHNILSRMCDKVSNSYMGCRAGHKLLGVSIDGDLYPCHRFVSYRKSFDYKIGNVYNGGVDYECDNWKKLLKMHSEAGKECGDCAVYSCNRCYATNIHMNNSPGQRPKNGYCDMNHAVSRMLTKKIYQLILGKKLGIKRGEMIVMKDEEKIAVNLGEGTEIYDDYKDLIAGCLVKLVKENQIIKSRLLNIEKHFGIDEIKIGEK